MAFLQYRYASVSEVVAAVSSRLYDSTNQQWTVEELTDLLTEALRTWNALSQFWRSEMVFPLQQNVWWYDLRTQNNTIIPYEVTQGSIVQQIQRHLLEPVNVTGWTGSAQFSLDDILTSCQRRQNDVIGESACTLERIMLGAATVRRTTLPDDTIDIRRIAWFPAVSGYSNRILKQSDAWATRAYQSGYLQSAVRAPSKWMQNTQPPPSFDVDSIPPVSGDYEVILSRSGPVWQVSATASAITVPTDWAWVVKWGALGDLLWRESNASDPLRAAYCRSRYMEGVALMRMMPVSLSLLLNNVPLSLGAVKGGDTYNATWQAKPAGVPASAYTDMNLMAFAPKPDSSSAYSAGISVAMNAPIDQNFVQVAQDDLDAIIDYVQHLAMFKQGGQEFANTIPLYQNFQKKAASYNGKLTEMGFFSMDQLELSDLDEARNARFRKGTEPTTASV